MLAAAKTPILPATHNQNPEGRRIPLQPKNIINSEPNIKLANKPRKDHHNHAPISLFTPSNKENNPSSALPIDASLAEELTAVRKKLERLRLEREKTEKMLQERSRVLDFQMVEMEQRGEFQKELENEVDRLYRLKQLKLACTRRSPIRSLREREMEKKNNDAQFEGSKVWESKEESVGENSITGSPTMSVESTTTSISASMSSASSTSASTSNLTSRKTPIPLRLDLESASEN